MRGHLPLLEMRRRGAVPEIVFVDTEPGRMRQWAEWPALHPDLATIEVEPGDPLNRLDLRCVVGLRVSVSGNDEARVRAVVEACIAAQANRVVGTVTHMAGGNATVVLVTDTATGETRWPTC